MAKVASIFRGRLKSPSSRSTMPAFFDGHEMPDAARCDRPLQPAIGPQISVRPAHAGHQHHFASDRGDGLLRPQLHGHVVPGESAHRLVEIPLVGRIVVGRRRRCNEDVLAAGIDARGLDARTSGGQCEMPPRRSAVGRSSMSATWPETTLLVCHYENRTTLLGDMGILQHAPMRKENGPAHSATAAAIVPTLVERD